MPYELNLDLNNIVTVSPSNPIRLSDIRLNQLYRIVADPNVIDETGKNKIMEKMQAVNLRDPDWRKMLPPNFDPYDYNNGFENRLAPLPDDWSWFNTITDKKSDGAKYGTGKFAKRVRAYILKTQGLALPEKFIQDLGQIAGRYSDQSTGTVLRFVNEFNWKAGDFGDPHSCFWGGREEARVMLKENGAWAVQLFSPESIEAGEPKGLARMWIVRNYPQKNLWMMFNGYGYGMGEPSLTIARMMVSMIGETRFRETKLGNHDSDSGTLYINSGNGYVIGTPTEELESYYDFMWSDEPCGQCRHCGENLYDNGDPHMHDDEYYCNTCWDEYIRYDEIANEHFDSEFDGMVLVYRQLRSGRFEDIYVSDSTAERYAEQCHSCSDYYVTEDMIYVETSSNYYCPDCASDHVSVCEDCGTEHESDDVTVFEDKVLCAVCLEDAQEVDEEVEEA